MDVDPLALTMRTVLDSPLVDMHPGQLRIGEDVVRALVDRQFPRWRDLPVRAVPSEGTVNALFRLGPSLVARFPLVPGDADDVRRRLEAEAEAAGELLGRTRFPTPEPVALGAPGPGYPLPWSVQTWLPGTVATVDDPGGFPAFAHDLAEFIHGVRSLDTRGRTFRGCARSGRGGDLPDHDDWVQACLDRSAGLVDVPRVRSLWSELRDLPPSGDDLMTHGDLIPGNVLVSEGRLAGVLDVGGLGPADRALDLVAAWHLLEAEPREVLRTDLDCSAVEWARGAAWALEQAVGLVRYYLESNPAMSSMGRRTLGRLATFRP